MHKSIPKALIVTVSMHAHNTLFNFWPLGAIDVNKLKKTDTTVLVCQLADVWESAV